MSKTIIAFVLAATLLFGFSANAQSLSERIAGARKSIAANAGSDPSSQALRLNRRKMLAQLPTVDLKNITAEEAVTWLESIADIKVLVNWQRVLEEEGISSETEVVVVGKNLTTQAALDMILRQIAIDTPLMSEVTPWYIRIITKAQADANPILRVYPIGDLLITVPNFDQAPDFDLQSISQSGGSSGGGGGSGGNIFDDNEEDDDEEGGSRDERAETIASLIRESVQPDIWRANGGLHSAITVYGDSLIVRAPLYVHREIGGDPLPSLTTSSSFSGGQRTGAQRTYQKPETYRERRRRSPDTLYKSKGK